MRLKILGIWVVGLLLTMLALFFLLPAILKPSSLGLLLIPMIGMALSLAADKKTEYREGVEIEILVYQYVLIYAGAFVCVNAGGYAVPGDDATGLIFEGIARENANNYPAGVSGAITVKVRRRGLFKMTFATAISIANVGDNVFLASDETVDVAGNVTYNIFVGNIAKYIDTTHAWVDIEPAIRQADVATHIADPSAAHAASAISFADSGNKTAATEVDGALDEIYQDLLSAKRIMNLPIFGWQGTAGVALAAFADGDSDVPGYCVTAEGYGIRWNNKSTHGNIIQPVVLPPDLDETADIVLHILAAKVGATIGDATKFTITAFNNVIDALYDADDDFGGDSDAMVGDATSKTVQHLTLTLALANLTAYPAVMQLTLQPKNTTLATDDVIVFATWLEYTRKILTS